MDLDHEQVEYCIFTAFIFCCDQSRLYGAVYIGKDAVMDILLLSDGFSMQILLYDKLPDARLVIAVCYEDIDKVIRYCGLDLLDEEVLFLKD